MILKTLWENSFVAVIIGSMLIVCLPACNEETPAYRFCENEDELALAATCDILTPACQQAVFEVSKCVNASNMPIPPVRTASGDAYLEELGLLENDTDSQTINSDTDSSTDTDSQEDSRPVDYWTVSLQLLGLMAQQTSMADAYRDDYASDVLAYYSFEYQDVTIIEQDELSYYTEPMRLLAHEFTHAIQDYEVGLNEQHEMYSHNDDILMAQQNAEEGDAEVRSDFAYAMITGVDIDELYTRAFYERDLAYYKRNIAAAASPYVIAKKGLPYATGTLYVYDTFINEGIDGINRLRENFPTSTVYWMAGYAASRQTSAYMSDQSRPTHFNEALLCGEAPAPNEYGLEHQDTLGAAMLYAVLSSQRVDGLHAVESSWNFSLNWRGDTLRIFQQTDGDNIAAVWHLRMASAQDAKRLKNLLQIRHPKAHILQFGSEVIEFLSEDDTFLADWANLYRCETRRD